MLSDVKIVVLFEKCISQCTVPSSPRDDIEEKKREEVQGFIKSCVLINLLNFI